MITREDIQGWLDRIEGGSAAIEELEPNLWRVRTAEGAEVVVHYAPPVVILRVLVMELPAITVAPSGIIRSTSSRAWSPVAQ